MIWEKALPGPRIVYIEPHRLAPDQKSWSREEFMAKINEKPSQLGDGGNRVGDTSAGVLLGSASDGNDDGRRDDLASAESVDHTHWGIKSDCTTPTILFACRESFQVASQFYSPAFSCRVGRFKSIPQTYFDFRRDTLYIDNRIYERQFTDAGIFEIGLQALWNRQELAKVQNLALGANVYDLRDGDDDGDDDGDLASWLAKTLGYFSKVKNLTIVVEHCHDVFVEETGFTDENATLTFLDDVYDVCEAFDIYEEVTPWDREPLQIPLNGYAQEAVVDLDKLERFRMKWNGTTEKLCPWEMPKIEYKTLMSVGLKSKLQAMEKDYLNILRANRRRLPRGKEQVLEEEFIL